MKNILPEQTSTIANSLRHAPHAVYQFHDIHVTCHANDPAILHILDDMLRLFPASGGFQGEAAYTVLCHEPGEPCSLSLPEDSRRTDMIRLLTNTKLTYYRSDLDARRYQVYDALPGVNGRAVSVIDAARRESITEIELPIAYQSTFLRRYVFLLALGQLMHPFGFEPCHAGVVTAPWDDQAGALIVGGSGSGKTTLSVGCACAGFGLLGDDIVMLRRLTEDGPIAAFAISHEVSIRPATLDLYPELLPLAQMPVDRRGKRYCAIDLVRQGAAHLRTTVRLLLFPSLAAEGKSRIIPLSKAQTLQRLIDDCMGKSSLPLDAQKQLFSFLSLLVEQAPGYQLVIASGANDGPQLVSSLLAGDTR